MTDGTRLRQSWYNALSQSEDYFRTLLKSSASAEWKRIVTTLENSSPRGKGKARASAAPELTDVVVHRRAAKSGDAVYRAVMDVPTGDEPVVLDPWKSVLMTPELRKEWDPAVEGARLLEMLDPTTRISKTNFTLGWPANPRDAVTISRTFNDATTLMDISTSLPRSIDEPAYLRPSPPFVRSDVKLFAWCIQYLQSSPQQGATADSKPVPGRLRIACFWQHDLKAMWNFGSVSGLSQQLAAMVLGLYKTVQNRGARVPLLLGYGNGVSLERIKFDIDREALTLDYSIVPEEEDHASHLVDKAQGLDLHSLKEHRRLLRSIECALPASQGWDVQLTTKASSEKVGQLPWDAQAIHDGSRGSSPSQSPEHEKFLFRVKHSPLPDDHSLLKVRVVIEISGPSRGLRLNGVPKAIEQIEERDPSSYFMSQQILQDATSTADLSFHTASTGSTTSSVASSSRTTTIPTLTRTPTERTAGAEKAVLSQVRRKYIYFSSLLQEPEAKWKRTTEGRGVEVTQLDSIDPTLVVYRAEVTFVGVGLWDLFGAIVTPGARVYWDKQHEDAVLLEDVNELSELWHVKTRPAWPVNGRDSVLLRTVYKAPTTIHVFAFSADNLHLFPNVPAVDPNVIRTQVDLQGWAIEALSPTTTLVTLLEQSDPKGWSNKASIPQQMITALAGIGEFAIKCGGPPAATRLAGAKANEVRYDHERGSFRIEYEVSQNRRADELSSNSALNGGNGASSSIPLPLVECEIRCDMDAWAPSLDIVVDPPPQSISCLRRHRLSANGGGLWLTISHDAVFASDERILVIIRKGPGRDKGVVMLNGAKVNVDVEDLPESEVKSLTKQKRVKPARIPLDQPPVVGVIRRRRAEWEGDGEGSSNGSGTDEPQSSSPSSASFTSVPKFSSPLARFFTMAVEQATTTTQQAVAAMAPTTMAGTLTMPSPSKPPMEHALEALSHVRNYCSNPSPDGWTLISEKGFPVHRKFIPEISSPIPVHKGEKVIEGVSAEEMASVITSYGCRKQWDDRFDSAMVFEEFGARCHTAFLVTKGGFPFRDRGFYVASILARTRPRSPISPTTTRRNSGMEADQESRAAILCVTTSFSADSVASFSPAKYNPYNLPVGRFFIDAWILETLDPYAEENYAIPSTMCTRLVAADYAGSIPAAVNSMINGMLPRSILTLETYMKGISPLPFSRLPRAGLFIPEQKKDEPFKDNSWAFVCRDSTRSLVTAGYTPEDLVYRSMITLSIGAFSSSSAAEALEDKTPRPSRIGGSSLPEVKHRSHQSEDFTKSTGSFGASTLAPSSRDGSHSRETLRGSTSTFNLRGAVRAPNDFLVGEIIVDSKTYPKGYEVRLRSSIKDPKKKYVPTQSVSQDSSPQEEVVPVTATVHTLPPSPLYSAGLNAERPPQHLVRLTIPTAQYLVSTIQDPLTGETRSAPPKPQWMLDLEEKGSVWNVEIRPASTNASSKRDGITVLVNGTHVPITSEKESLTSLGRDELQNSRISKMNMLVRTSEAEDQIPEELREPIAVSEHLYEATVLESLKTPEQDGGQTSDVNSKPEAKQDTVNSTNIPHGNPAPEGDTSLAAASGGLLGFLNSYPNPLARFTSSTSRASLRESPSSTSPSELGKSPPGGLAEVERPLALTTLTTTAVGAYPLSTLLVVAIIAFLLGSFLRSLLSPADFIYVVTDMKDLDESTVGWREIRRLLEIKYLIGGWDFQIAVVRRH